MLISKTVCPAGSLAYIVPTGLQLTLHYDARGSLMNVYLGYDKKTDLGQDFLKELVKLRLIPNAIKLTGGITDIWGVIYSDKISSSIGLLPNCEYDNIKADVLSGTPGYKFYVGNVVTGATSIIDPTSMTTWANMCGFEVLSLWTIPENPTDALLANYISNIQYPFKYPFIAGYIIFEGANDPYYYSADLKTAHVEKVKKYTDTNGYIKYDVSYGNTKITLNYPEAVKFNVQKGSQLIIDRQHIIWCDTQSSKTSHRLAVRITCEYCGKILDVPETGVMCCTDNSCTSLLYPKIEHLCNTLGLKLPTPAQVKKYIKANELQILSDFLLLPDYSDTKIEVSMWEIIHAVIPAEIGISKDWLIQFCNKCNNQYKTIKYYLDGPRRITTELDMEVPIRFARWLNVPQNITELDTIINSSQIVIKDTGKLAQFDAPLLFLHKTIFITGTFKHGSLVDITTILQSYGAVVVTEYDEFIDYVLIGDIKDNIKGEAIIGARALGIPVVEESAFFAHYGIDADLQNNLV